MLTLIIKHLLHYSMLYDRPARMNAIKFGGSWVTNSTFCHSNTIIFKYSKKWEATVQCAGRREKHWGAIRLNACDWLTYWHCGYPSFFSLLSSCLFLHHSWTFSVADLSFVHPGTLCSFLDLMTSSHPDLKNSLTSSCIDLQDLMITSVDAVTSSIDLVTSSVDVVVHRVNMLSKEMSQTCWIPVQITAGGQQTNAVGSCSSQLHIKCRELQ